MNRLDKKKQNSLRRQQRVRAVVRGTTEQPRLSVFVSNRHITAQIIDDSAQRTLAYATTVGQKNIAGNMTEQAIKIGEEIAQQAKNKKVRTIVFDRGSRLYHGRIKALADAARAKGLEF